MHIRTRHAAPWCFRVRVFGSVGYVKAPLKLAEALVKAFFGVFGVESAPPWLRRGSGKGFHYRIWPGVGGTRALAH